MLRVDRKVLGYKMKMNIFLGEGVDWIMSILCIWRFCHSIGFTVVGQGKYSQDSDPLVAQITTWKQFFWSFTALG